MSPVSGSATAQAWNITRSLRRSRDADSGDHRAQPVHDGREVPAEQRARSRPTRRAPRGRRRAGRSVAAAAPSGSGGGARLDGAPLPGRRRRPRPAPRHRSRCRRCRSGLPELPDARRADHLRWKLAPGECRTRGPPRGGDVHGIQGLRPDRARALGGRRAPRRAGVVGAVAYNVTQPKVYQAAATGLRHGRQDPANRPTPRSATSSPRPQVTSYVAVATSTEVADDVIRAVPSRALDLATTPGALIGQITVSQPTDTVLITIARPRRPTRRTPQALANAWVDALAARGPGDRRCRAARHRGLRRRPIGR